MDQKSRAEYFRDRRKKLKQLVFMVDKEKAEKLDEVLRSRNESRIDWFRRKLDEEIQKIIEQAVRVWLAAHKNVTAVVPADKTLGYNASSDITNDIMAEIRWYKPSFPPMPRPRGAA